MKILIAEDDVASRIALVGVLEDDGHEVIAAADGAEAWEAMQKSNAPMLAILDWMMPEMDGLEVVRRIRALPTERRPYLIVLTPRGDKADVVTGLKAGANDYLSKPFDEGELRVRIEVGRQMIELQSALAAKIDELRGALERIKTLHGILPICARCKKIRDDKGYWNQLEVYIRDHSEAEFTHGICPVCEQILYPEFCQNPVP